eukprot:XP_012820574.2 PREDICTED: DC-STAMP domain-containing protein 1-like [Xenopus tropicalis]
MNEKEMKQKIREMIRKKKSKGLKCLLYKEKRPNSTITRILVRALPNFVLDVFFSEENKYRILKILFRTILGFLVGLLLHFTLVQPFYNEPGNKNMIRYGIAVIISLGWAVSAYFRCMTILVFPSILEKRANIFICIFALNLLLKEPFFNMYDNMYEVLISIGCTAEMKINHTKLMLQVTINPLRKIIKDLVVNAKELKNYTLGILNSFQEVRAEVESTEGYNKDRELKLIEQQKKEGHPLNTQQKFTLKNMLRCEGMMESGVNNCRNWFKGRYLKCKEKIAVPILYKVICLPLNMTFLCNIQKAVLPFCKKHSPMDEDFGQLFDNLSASIDNLTSDFDVDIDVEKADDSRSLKTSFATAIKAIKSGPEKVRRMASLVSAIFWMSLVSVMFICLLSTAYGYVYQYNKNIHHDNNYITTYFRQIDARRRKRRQRHLLPLRRGEYVNFVFPFKMKLQGEERETAARTLYTCLPFIAIFIIVFGLSQTLGRILAIINKAAYVTYTFSSQHKIDFVIEGTGFFPKVLRNTIGRLNSSSVLEHNVDNSMCVPKPHLLTAAQYWVLGFKIALILLTPVLQAYMNRLPRAIAAFFFPKREKVRVLYMYNMYLRKRAAYAKLKRRQVMLNAKRMEFMMSSFIGIFYRHCKFLRRFLVRRCLVCNSRETTDSYVCRTPDCDAVYCRQCWKDMDRYCFACMPKDEFISDASESDYEFKEY